MYYFFLRFDGDFQLAATSVSLTEPEFGRISLRQMLDQASLVLTADLLSSRLSFAGIAAAR